MQSYNYSTAIQNKSPFLLPHATPARDNKTLQFIFLTANYELMQPVEAVIWDLLVDLQTRRGNPRAYFTPNKPD